MAVKFCPYCNCLFLPNGRCRNSLCILGKSDVATIKQIEFVYSLCEELGISTEGKDPDKLSKDKAGKLIRKLLARKALTTYTTESEETSDDDDSEVSR